MKPRIIAPIDAHDLRSLGRRNNETLVGLISLKLRVEGNPYLATILADGGYQHVPGMLAHRLRFLDPHNVAAFVGLDVSHVLANARENKLSAIAPYNRMPQDFVVAGESQFVYLVAQQLMHRIGNRFHRLPRA